MLSLVFGEIIDLFLVPLAIVLVWIGGAITSWYICLLSTTKVPPSALIRGMFAMGFKFWTEGLNVTYVVVDVDVAVSVNAVNGLVTCTKGPWEMFGVTKKHLFVGMVLEVEGSWIFIGSEEENDWQKLFICWIVAVDDSATVLPMVLDLSITGICLKI